jgi:hypothetical protein
MGVNECMNQSLKNWLSAGAPLLVIGVMFVALCVRTALGITWGEVIVPAFWFGLIQIIWFGAMYFARNYGGAHDNLRPGILVSGLYCLTTGLLAIHYSAKWGLMGLTALQSNYEEFTILVVVAIFILMFLPFRLKL